MKTNTWLMAITLFCCAFSHPVFAAKNSFKKSKQRPQKEATSNSKVISKKESLPPCPYEMSAPKGWQRIDDKTQLPAKVELVFIGTGKGQFTPSINLATEKTEMSIQDYVALAKNYHESQGETTCHLLGTLETREGTAQLLQIDRKTQWGNVRFLQAALVKEGLAYVITATCLQDEFGALYGPFFHSIQTFTINRS